MIRVVPSKRAVLSNALTGSAASGNVLSNDTDVDSVATWRNESSHRRGSGVAANPSGSVASGVVGSYGTITVNADGSYTYVVDETNAAVQALRTAADTIADVSSAYGYRCGRLDIHRQVTITIHGRNDAPVGVNDTGIAVEAGGVNNTPQVQIRLAMS